MFPSPSLAPPLLSLSESPPLFWGIPDVDELLLEELAAGALEDLLDELEPPPQPATTRKASTSRPGAQRLIEPLLCVMGMPFRVLCEAYVSRPPARKRTSGAGDPSYPVQEPSSVVDLVAALYSQPPRQS